MSALKHARLNVDEAGPEHEGVLRKSAQPSRRCTRGFAAIAERVKEEVGFDYLWADRDRASPGLPTLMEGGAELSASSFARANEVRTAWYDAVQSLLAEYDLLVTPMLSVTPPPIGDEQVPEFDGRSIGPYTGWLLTWPFD